jgi:hypothetical protein
MKVFEIKPNTHIVTAAGIELLFEKMSGIYGKCKNEKGELVYVSATETVEQIHGFTPKQKV